MSMDRRKYESSIDLIKITACVLVVGLHTLNGNLGTINYILVQTAIISVPIFFVVNGYLLFQKEEVLYTYVLKKIGNILKVCMFWEIAHACAYYVYYREVRNFIQSFFYDFIQKGLFYHFWFFGALILIYSIFPLLHKLKKKKYRVFEIVLLGLGLLCAGLHIGQLIVRKKYILEVIQTFRIWIWLFYFMLGGWISSKKEILKKSKMISPLVRGIALIIVGICLITWEYYMGMKYFGSNFMNEAYHGAIITMLTTLAVFILVSQITIPKNITRYIKKIAETTMGVYIMHPFILAVLMKFFPIVGENWWMNLFYWVSTCAISMIISFIISKLPGIRNMIKL